MALFPEDFIKKQIEFAKQGRFGEKSDDILKKWQGQLAKTSTTSTEPLLAGYYDPSTGVGYFEDTGERYEKFTWEPDKTDPTKLYRENAGTGARIGTDYISAPRSNPPTPTVDPYEQMMREIRAQQDELAEARRRSRIASLTNARDSAYTALDRESSTIKPYYYGERNKAAARSDLMAKNFAEHMASRGIQGAAGGMPEIYRNIGLQGEIGKLKQQEAAEVSDIARRRSGVESAYQNDVASANADIDADTMQAYIDAMKTVQAQRLADNAAKGLTSIGEPTMAAQDRERQNYLSTIGRFSDDYQAEINRVQSDDDPSNDWQVAYLQSARQNKLQEMAEARAASAAAASEAEQQQYKTALELWKTSGVANQQIADILGVPVGARTADYNIDSINAATSRMNAETAQMNANKPQKPEAYDYNTDPNFQSEVADIAAGRATLADVQANAAELQAAYGYDGYMELLKLATPK
jgi:hypothetical protein